MDNINLKTLFFTLLFVLSSCGVQKPYIIKNGLEGDGAAEDKIKLGPAYEEIKEETSLTKNKPIVMIFSEYYCNSCQEEHIALRDELNKIKVAKKSLRVDFVTFLIGNDPDGNVVTRWKEKLKIPWIVKRDEKEELFHKYCGYGNTIIPCVVVALPQKGVIFAKKGKSSIAEIQKYSGDFSGEPIKEDEVETGTIPEREGPNQNGNSNGNEGATTPVYTLTGEFLFFTKKSSEGEYFLTPIDLSLRGKGKPVLLLFSTLGCMDCESEHEYLAKIGMEDSGGLLGKISLVTFIINSEIGSDDFKVGVDGYLDLGVSWPIGDSRGKELFVQLCKKEVTPCLAIFDKNNKLLKVFEDKKLEIKELEYLLKDQR